MRPQLHARLLQPAIRGGAAVMLLVGCSGDTASRPAASVLATADVSTTASSSSTSSSSTSTTTTAASTTSSSTTAPAPTLPPFDCSTDALNAPLRGQVPEGYDFEVIGNCEDGYALVTLTPNPSSCSGSSAGCPPALRFYLEADDGGWSLLASGTDLLCGPDPANYPPDITSACGAFED